MTEPDPLEPPAAKATARNRPGRPRRQHDARAKLLFSHERTARELLGHIGALPEDREVQLIKWSTEWIRLQEGNGEIPTRLARELGDQVWLVCGMDGRPLGTALLEFKADHDPDAARQITHYLFDLWQDARRLAALRAGADAVPTRAALVHTGPMRWTADLSLPAVAPDGTITPQPGIFLLDVGRTEPGIFPEGSLLAHIIPLERCRGRLQWERGMDETAVVAEASRLWEGLRPLAAVDDSLWQVLLDWLRSGFADYIQNTNWEERGEGMYATMSEAYAARRAEEAQRITESVTLSTTIGLLTDYVRERHGHAVGEAVADILADWQDARLPTFNELDALAEEAQRITESVTESVTLSTTIGLLTDYVRERHGHAVGEAVADFLADWQDARLPTFNELDALAVVHRDGQDLQAWWAQRLRSELSNGKANGNSPTPSPN